MDVRAAADAPQLTPELERGVLRVLRDAWALINYDRFREQLRMPVIALGDDGKKLGQWKRVVRTLEISRSLIVTRPWTEVIAVLEHEMAHQYVEEVLRVLDETAHGETFRRVCAERGIDARAAGVVVPAASRAAEDERITGRIRKLLALAASPNRNEAEAAMNRAHELMLRYNIEHVDDGELEVRYVGEAKKRGNALEAEIVSLLSEYFFVEAISIQVYLPLEGAYARVYELCGTPENLDMAEHVFAFLKSTAERLWAAHHAGGKSRNGHDRRAYVVGVIRGFRDKLRRERDALATGEGLVWVGNSRLEEFYRRRHPRIVRRRRAVRFDAAHRAGREAGAKVVLHKPVTSSGSGGVRLLRG